MVKRLAIAAGGLVSLLAAYVIVDLAGLAQRQTNITWPVTLAGLLLLLGAALVVIGLVGMMAYRQGRQAPPSVASLAPGVWRVIDRLEEGTYSVPRPIPGTVAFDELFRYPGGWITRKRVVFCLVLVNDELGQHAEVTVPVHWELFNRTRAGGYVRVGRDHSIQTERDM